MLEDDQLTVEESSVVKSFWNEVVKNRKVVKQAKIHLINKLSKQVKKFGDDDKSQKRESLVDQISATKTLFADDVTKFCFLQPVGEIQQYFKKATTKDDLAKVKLCLTKPLRKATEDFQTKYPEWEKIGALLEKPGRFKRKKKTPKKKKGLKDGPGLTPAVNDDPRFGPDSLNEDEFSEFRPQENGDQLSLVTDDEPQRLENVSFTLKKLTTQDIKRSSKQFGAAKRDSPVHGGFLLRNNVKESAISTKKDAPSQNESVLLPERMNKVKAGGDSKPLESKLNLRKKRTNSETIRTKSSSFTVETTDDDAASMHPLDVTTEPIKKKTRHDTGDGGKTRHDSRTSPPALPNSPTVVDPFFITSDSRGYLTHATLDKPPPVVRPESVVRERSGSNFGGPRNRRERRALERKPPSDFNSPKKPSQKHRGNLSQNREGVGEKLHPSWQAKKSLAPKIMPFQGKKVVFE